MNAMPRLAIAIVLALLLCAPVPAPAQVWTSVGTVQGNFPLDGIATSVGAYSFRRLLSSYATNKGVNIVRASDSAVTDIGFVSGGPDTAAITTFCAATTCKLVTIYDQAGTRNLTQATDGNRPAIAASCLGARHCFQATAATMGVTGLTNITPSAALVSFSVVANRAVGTGQANLIRENGVANRWNTNAGAGAWLLLGGTSGSFTAAAADAAWHAASAVINGASSVQSIDGVDTTGTAVASVAAGTPNIAGAGSTTLNEVETIIWDNYALSASERAYLSTNQKTYWGF